MSKQAVIDAVAAKTGLTKEKASEAINAVAEALHTVVSTGSDVRLAGLGTFKLKHTAERQGRNPKTGEAITIAASEKVSFKPSKKG